MPKGHSGQTCGEAIRTSIGPNEIVSASSLFDRAKKLGAWRDETIWQHLVSLVVNLPPARQHWPSTDPFLFLRPDGRYELYDERKHPQVTP
jgi:hypothetical protein